MPKPRAVVLMTREMQVRVFSERHLPGSASLPH